MRALLVPLPAALRWREILGVALALPTPLDLAESAAGKWQPGCKEAINIYHTKASMSSCRRVIAYLIHFLFLFLGLPQKSIFHLR